MPTLPDSARSLATYSRRQEVIELVRELRGLNVPLWILAPQCEPYATMLAAQAQLHQLKIAWHTPLPLSQTDAWQAWWRLQELLSLAQEGAPLRNAMIAMLHASIWKLPDPHQAGRQLHEVTWGAPFPDYLARLRQHPSTQVLAEQFAKLPAYETWEPGKSAARLALAQWLTPYVSAGTDWGALLQLLASPIDQIAELAQRARETPVERQALGEVQAHFVALDAAIDLPAPLPSTAQIWVLGASEQAYGNRLFAWLKKWQVQPPSASAWTLSTPIGSKSEPLTPLKAITRQIQWHATPRSACDQPQSNYPMKSALSMSEVAHFALCPYRYFTAVDLKMREREKFDPLSLSVRTLGELAHAFFETELVKASHDVLPNESIWQALLQRFFPQGLQGSFQVQQWQELKHKLQEALLHEAAWLRQVGGTPKLFERPLTLQLSGVEIRCRIDRVDELLRPDGTRGLMVVDYKTSGGEVGPKRRQQMAQLILPQLPIYMLALKQMQTLPVVAGREFHLRSLKAGGLAVDAIASQLKNKVYELLPERRMLEEFSERLQHLLQEMQSGVRQAKPQDLDACGLGNCFAWGLCRYDRVEEEPDDLD